MSMLRTRTARGFHRVLYIHIYICIICHIIYIYISVCVCLCVGRWCLGVFTVLGFTELRALGFVFFFRKVGDSGLGALSTDS